MMKVCKYTTTNNFSVLIAI